MPSLDDKLPVDTIEDTLAAFKNGEFVIVLDSPSRENEGDLIIAADAMTPSKMAFLIRFSSGIICTPLPPSLCDTLQLPQMLPPSSNADPNGTAYTVSIDANHPDTTTGVSASDRSLTCVLLGKAASNASTGAGTGGVVGAEAFRRPGHVFPLRAREGGVLERQGHTEAAVDLCRLTGRAPAGVISEMVDDGVEGVEGKAEFEGAGMMRAPACLEFAKRWGLRICTIEDLVEYRSRMEGKTGVNGAV